MPAPSERLFARVFLAMSLLFAPLNAYALTETADQPLSAYRDKNRVLLVFTPSEKDAAYTEQGRLWQSERAGFEERQLVVVPVLADAARAAGDTPGALQKKYGIEPKTFAVVLLGKDGHDAYRASRPVKGASLYEVIDSMPMRKDEMKRQRSSTTKAHHDE